MRFMYHSCITALVFFLACCGAAFAAETEGKNGGERELKIGFVYISPVGDAGWSFAHDEGRRKLSLNPANVTFVAEGVPGGEDAEYVIDSMSRKGYDIIVTTSFNYMDSTINVAKNYPGVTYLHCSGYKTAPNVSNFFGRIHEPRYLSGMVAGSMTKSNVIGFVAAFPIPEVIRGINAFALGARDVNPDVEIRVLWSRSWYDPYTETELTKKLIREGADVIGQDQDSAFPQLAAEEEGVYSVGYNTDMSTHAPEAHLVAAVWNWSVFYEDVVRQVRAGTWKSGSYMLGMDSGIVDISPFGRMVPEKVRETVLARRKEIIDGSFHVFQGPVRDQAGNIRVPAGAQLSDEALVVMDWFVEGITGTTE